MDETVSPATKRVQVKDIADTIDGYVMLYETEKAVHLLNGIHKITCETNITSSYNTVIELPSSRCFNRTACSICDITFPSHVEQVCHFKSDWHHFNIRRQLHHCLPVTQLQFENLHLESESSISGSESTTSSEDNVNDSSLKTDGRKLLFYNTKGQLLSIHRCIMMDVAKNADTVSDAELYSVIRALPTNMYWIILMASGGHFAGAVFDGANIVRHKTFHRYVVRAKRGTSQSSRDSKGGNAPKSAGASLRRHNEAAFTQEIRDLMDCWKDDFVRCSRIFLRAPGRNRDVFFGGKNPILSKCDVHLCSISVETKRPTFREVKRIHRLLATIEVNDEKQDIVTKAPEIETEQTSSIDASIISLLPVRTESYQVLPTQCCNATGTIDESCMPAESAQNKAEKCDVVKQALEIITQQSSSVDASAISLLPVRTGSYQMLSSQCCNATGTKDESCVPVDSEESVQNKDDVYNRLYTACKTGIVDEVHNLLSVCDTDIVNRRSGRQMSTLLHVSSKAGHVSLVSYLLQHGTDPTIRDTNNNPPYVVAANKEVKCAYRRFMAENMDLYDYTQSQIPGPLTDEIEAERKTKEAERKKAKRNVKKEKLKQLKITDEITKQEMEIKQQEEAEKMAFLALNDREKRAFAAEQRLKLQVQKAPTILRCWQCAADISQQIPFEYSDYKFCSPSCLKTHRLKSS